MAKSSGVPGFDEAVAKERAARNGAYLNVPRALCGFKVRDIDLTALAILTEAKTPFLFGGYPTEEHFIQFIACIQVARDIDAIAAAIVDGADLESWCAEIDSFIELTYLDAPQGGSDEAPIASACAWIEYRMTCEPFRWPQERIFATPLRRIYQLIRCWEREQGVPVVNPLSGKCESEWLDLVNEELKRDPEGTRAKLEEIQARAACAKAGIKYTEGEE